MPCPFRKKADDGSILVAREQPDALRSEGDARYRRRHDDFNDYRDVSALCAYRQRGTARLNSGYGYHSVPFRKGSDAVVRKCNTQFFISGVSGEYRKRYRHGIACRKRNGVRNKLDPRDYPIIGIDEVSYTVYGVCTYARIEDGAVHPQKCAVAVARRDIRDISESSRPALSVAVVARRQYSSVVGKRQKMSASRRYFYDIRPVTRLFAPRHVARHNDGTVLFQYRRKAVSRRCHDGVLDASQSFKLPGSVASRI